MRKSSKNNITRLILVLALSIGSTFIYGQYTLAVNGAYTFGFNSKDLKLANTGVSQNWYQGYQFSVSNGFQFKEAPIEITSRIGMKHLISAGSFQNLPFSTETYKFTLGLGSLYHLESKFTVGALVVLENNLDFDQFISQTSDLFRFSLQGETYYAIGKRIDLWFLYSLALTPLSDHYLITNPQHQIALGIKYCVL